jgi:diguanylate cyclase (GGDEF)-like protein
VLGGGYVFVALVAAFGVRGLTLHHVVALVVLVVLYGVAFRTVFQHVGRTATVNSTVPTEPALIAMLFLLPLGLVPLAVLLAQLLGDPQLGRAPREVVRTLAIRALNGWHCVGPVLVLSLAGVTEPDAAQWRVLLLALAAQFAFDLASGALRAAALGDGVTPILRPMAWTFAIDAALAVIGFCAVATGLGLPMTLVLVAVPIGLVALLAGDRRELAHSTVRLDREISDARSEARIDALTGLGNRRAWSEAVEAAEAALVDGTLRADVVVADIDGLKEANDSRGHEAGDALIRAMSEVARATAPPGTTVCRTGGDEFAFLRLVDRDTPPVAELVEVLRDAVAARGQVAGGLFSVAVAGASSPEQPSIAQAFRVGDAASACRR